MAKWFDDLVARFLVGESTITEILEIELQEHLHSHQCKTMEKAQNYYKNHTDIKEKTKKYEWQHNSKTGRGLFKKFVDQKVGYLLSKEPTITVDGPQETQDFILQVFDWDMLQTLKAIGKEAIIKGVAYGLPYYDETGKLKLYKIPSEQIIPFYKDERRIELSAFMRVYLQYYYRYGKKHAKQVVEYWDEEGIQEFEVQKGKLSAVSKKPLPHFYYTDGGHTEKQGYVWDKIPLIPFRYNEEEESLLTYTKDMIDDLETIASINVDLIADLPQFIYVLKNYGGESIDEFLKNLNEYRAIKVRGDGGVEKLTAEPSTDSTESELTRTRKELYDAARAIDTQDENLGNASGIALQWRYTDLDLDCNTLETEMQKSLQLFMWFVKSYADNSGVELDVSTFNYIFNRDVISNETEAIQNCLASVGILDDKTIREQHPWYTPEVEERLKEQHQTEEDYHEFTDDKRGVGDEE